MALRPGHGCYITGYIKALIEGLIEGRGAVSLRRAIAPAAQSAVILS